VSESMQTGGSAILSRDGIGRGIRQMVPLASFVLPFGLAFGVAALQAGLRAEEAVLMSLVVFAGASQFAALEFWGAQIPLVPIVLATFAVNARHLLLGAALFPWLRHRPAWERYATAALISDVNWAVSMQAHERGERDVGLLVGGGLVLWFMWVAGTVAGVTLGEVIPEPERLGMDVLLHTFFVVTLVGMWKGRETLAPWTVAAATAVVASYVLPPGWHVLAGGLAGGIVGALRRAG
jgi:4-azaleucine resistance transporter AzlC